VLFDPPTLKTLPYRTKREMYQITRCGDMATCVSLILGKWEVVGVSDGTIRKSDGGFL